MVVTYLKDEIQFSVSVTVLRCHGVRSQCEDVYLSVYVFYIFRYTEYYIDSSTYHPSLNSEYYIDSSTYHPSLNTEYYIDSSTYHPSRPSACMRRYGRWLGRYCPLQSEYWTRGALFSW
jgi:hypothetical protein